MSFPYSHVCTKHHVETFVRQRTAPTAKTIINCITVLPQRHCALFYACTSERVHMSRTRVHMLTRHASSIVRTYGKHPSKHNQQYPSGSLHSRVLSLALSCGMCNCLVLLMLPLLLRTVACIHADVTLEFSTQTPGPGKACCQYAGACF